jgi:hypothetical protein
MQFRLYLVYSIDRGHFVFKILNDDRPSSGQSLAVGAEKFGLAVCGFCAGVGGGRLKALATTISWPGVCLMSDVKSAMKESCRCWRADQGGMVRNRDVTCGLCSVSRQRRRRSSMNLKCLTVLKAASNALTKVENFAPTPVSFFE